MLLPRAIQQSKFLPRVVKTFHFIHLRVDKKPYFNCSRANKLSHSMKKLSHRMDKNLTLSRPGFHKLAQAGGAESDPPS